MLVEFLQDFQGRETKEVFYKRGQQVDLPENMASVLQRDGRVRIVAGTPSDSSPAQMSEGVEAVHYGAQKEPELRNDEEKYEQMVAGEEIQPQEGETESEGEPLPELTEESAAEPKVAEPKGKKGRRSK